MIHDWDEFKKELNKTVFINSNISLGCLYSKDGVQFSHLNPPNRTHLFLPPT